MSKRSFRVALTIVLATAVVAASAGLWSWHRIDAYPDEAHEGSGAIVEVEIKPGMSFPRVAELLAQHRVIDRPRWFRFYAMWLGKTTDVKPGRYQLRDDLSARQVLAAVVAGVPDVTVEVTLPEGKHMLEFFALLEEAKVASAAELEVLARDPQFLSDNAIGADTVDGYLFPDTYRFRIDEKPVEVLRRLIEHHREVWNEVASSHARPLARLRQRLGWSDREILIMASIVEKEAVEPAERPRIAQVFINRLTSPDFRPRRLETDPTIRYGCMVPANKSKACQAWSQSDRLHRAQLDDADNPYNTYQHEGLPPGPICNPGRASLEATVDPDGSNYFYFVARNERQHVFSRTLAEHSRAVQQYQR
jgi:UPF0755 protein